MAINASHYETIISVLVDKIKEQETTIAVYKWQIEKFEKTLTELEIR